MKTILAMQLLLSAATVFASEPCPDLEGTFYCTSEDQFSTYGFATAGGIETADDNRWMFSFKSMRGASGRITGYKSRRRDLSVYEIVAGELIEKHNGEQSFMHSCGNGAYRFDYSNEGNFIFDGERFLSMSKQQNTHSFSYTRTESGDLKITYFKPTVESVTKDDLSLRAANVAVCEQISIR